MENRSTKRRPWTSVGCHQVGIRFLLLTMMWTADCGADCGPVFEAAADEPVAAAATEDIASLEAHFEVRQIEGWTVCINRRLLSERAAETERAIELTQQQLQAIERDVPEAAVSELRKVRLWFNPEYDGTHPRAEYHPSRQWLVENNRDPRMARCIEFSNVSIFEKEVLRMPVLVLHELAHAYHHQVLGYDHAGIQRTYEQALESGAYEDVKRWRGPDVPLTTERAYGMNNDKEYFAELTEAYFGRNDFFPFTRDELREHDPEGERLLRAIWGDAPDRRPDE